MKRRLAVAVLIAATLPAQALDGKSLLTGIAIGLGLYTYQGTRQHVILPTAHKIQRTIRPIPQDKADAQRRKMEKAARKAQRKPR